MSDKIFHRSCFTSRSLGYKYRTLSTNTGPRKRKYYFEESSFDKKFNELQKVISNKVTKHLDTTQSTRDHIDEQFEKVDAKINAILHLQDTVMGLRQNLITAENALSKILEKVERIEAASRDDIRLKKRNLLQKSNVTVFENDLSISL